RPTRLILVLLLIMSHILKILFCGFRAPDVWLLVIEVLVLGLIAWERFSSCSHSRKKQELLGLISKGEDLREALPQADESPTAQEQWAQRARQWLQDCERLVRKFPPYAQREFGRIEGRVDIAGRT